MDQPGLPLPDRLRVVEVGLRDGLQSVRETVPTDDKLRLVESLLESGVREIEAVSFAHPKVLPQLADAEALLARVPRGGGARYRGLVPNARGAQRAVDAGVDEMTVLTCTDPDVLMINQRRTPDQMWAELDESLAVARQHDIRVTVAVVMSFFAYGSGPISPERLDEFVTRVVGAGADSVYLADSAGMADPAQVYAAVRRVKAAHPGLKVGVHLHTRAGFALANTLAAVMAGVDWAEGSFCGLGGDLWLPGDADVLGNTPTEDLAAMLEYCGVRTGIDLDAYSRVVALAEQVTGRPTFGHLTRGGSREQMAAISWNAVLAQDGKQIPSTR